MDNEDTTMIPGLPGRTRPPARIAGPAAAPSTDLAPAAGASRAPVSTGGPAGQVPLMADAPATRRSSRGPGSANQAATSWLDLINKEMAELNTELTELGELLLLLGKTSSTLQQLVDNIDELGKLYEAPLATRTAADAASMVASLIGDMAQQARIHAYNTQACNANGKLGLRVVGDVQDSQRAIGAGPKLLATAGRS